MNKNKKEKLISILENIIEDIKNKDYEIDEDTFNCEWYAEPREISYSGRKITHLSGNEGIKLHMNLFCEDLQKTIKNEKEAYKMMGGITYE